MKYLMEREYYFCKFNFKTPASSTIAVKTLQYADKTLNREDALNKIMVYIPHIILADDIEKGLFEYALTYLSTKLLPINMLNDIYNYELVNICDDLDDSLNDLSDKTRVLRKYIMEYKIHPYEVAFMTPDERHPKHWESIIKNYNMKYEIANKVSTTDLYKCGRCGERKCTITMQQTRAADEPQTTIVKCMVCNNKFTK